MNRLIISTIAIVLFVIPIHAQTIQYCYGDSIAVGFCDGKYSGSRRVGASPVVVLGYLQSAIQSNPNIFRNKTVELSTGVSNNPYDFTSIERQFQLLKNAGANVIVIGAAVGRYNTENQKLFTLSQKYGFTFKGGFIPGADGVHPYTYSSYVTK